ncbi:hypothetical protein APS56_15035 [Pseudalgibacter alginicilyticus]|uniref:FecR family protein n=2 Tax=Pseudalgibacter alginicilyticus TaxID=1736674 RepID=A0A0P0DEB0_9FLAO|nr:hypothetical protein APS56_15035 [Pseudalgibacter alginicilyticus]
MELLSTDEGQTIYKDILDNEDINSVFETPAEKPNELIYKRITTSIKQEHKIKKLKTNHLKFAKVAATIAILISTAYSSYWLLPNINEFLSPITYTEISTAPGERLKNIELSDGSKVWLNASSTLRFPSKFKGNTREVFLEGEAFFEVSHNKNKAFIIQSGTLKTEVLGTSFNVNNYPENDHATVSLVTGKVYIETGNSSTEVQGKTLTPNQQLVYNKSLDKAELGTFNSKNLTAWRHDILTFDNERLDEAAHKIAHWYGIEIKLNNKVTDDCRITAQFENQDVNGVLGSLSYSMNLKYTIIDKVVYIDNAACD